MAPRQVIEIKKGVKVEVLFTPSLFGVAKRRGLTIRIEDKEDSIEVMEAYVKITYIAALNAWEARRYDNPEEEDFAYNYGDFQEWAGSNPGQFSKLIPVIFSALTGKDLKDVVTAEAEGNTPVKKKPRSTFWRSMISRLSNAF